ncbi:hypothetical protein E2C01_027770 [Portunus trituberculatus]|uniref:Uncharacterized protein n=1 Tax=Portunus trituberculatus TaxID=210409 RepID=A0A5B7EPR6_PORTR|nr:hypothetical protein [Portunus trituberculatus]
MSKRCPEGKNGHEKGKAEMFLAEEKAHWPVLERDLGASRRRSLLNTVLVLRSYHLQVALRSASTVSAATFRRVLERDLGASWRRSLLNTVLVLRSDLLQVALRSAR